MRSATVSTRAIRWQRIGFVIGFAACLSGPGCAPLRSTQASRGVPGSSTDSDSSLAQLKSSPPTPRTDPLKGWAGWVRPRSGPQGDNTLGTSSRTDLYAETLRKNQARATVADRESTVDASSEPNEVVAIRSTAHPVSETDQVSEENAQRARVALQPPAALSAPIAPAPRTPAPRESGWLPKAEATVAVPAGPSPATLVAAARAKLETLTTYQVQLNQQERIREALLPAQDVLMSIRRNPMAVRLEWTSGPNRGREVIYSPTENHGLMQVKMADVGVLEPRMALKPDSRIVMQNTRHPINEAGFDSLVADLEESVAREQAGDFSRGKLTYGGLERPQPLEQACHKLVRTSPSGDTSVVYLEPETKLPTLVQVNGAHGELLERHVFLEPRFDLPDLAQADAFDAHRRWGEPKSLLSRLSRAATGVKASAAPDTLTR